MRCVRKEIEDRGGKLLSSEYKGVQSKIHIRCENNHEFWIRHRNIRQGNWCRACYEDSLRSSEDDIRNIIELKGGTLLSKYRNSTTKIRVRCERGHVFDTAYKNIHRGCWCRKCYEGSRRLSEDSIRRFIESKGGLLLSNYTNSDSKIHIRCENGHETWVRYNDIQQGHWCIECYSRGILRREPLVRDILEDMFGMPFPNIRMEDIRNPDTGRPLELDCYNARLKIAVEVNGKQHYEWVPYFHKRFEDFRKQRNHDRIRREGCEALGIFLLEVSYVIPMSDLKEHLKNMLRDAGFLR